MMHHNVSIDRRSKHTLRILMFAALCLQSQFLLAHEASDVAQEMADAATRLIKTLDENQKTQLVMPWEADERRGWFFVPEKFIKAPGRRSGLPIGKMTPQQRILAYALLNSGLSHHGYQQASTIMAMEAVLRELENNNPIRDPELYYVTIFGTPSPDHTWSWRFEGHHLSINFTLVDGRKFAVTPSFFGGNPGTVRSGPWAGQQILADEETQAFKLIAMLNDKQRSKAIIDVKAPEDVITGQDREANKEAFLPVRGIAYSELNGEQKKILLGLVETFTKKYRPELLANIDKRKEIQNTRSMHFAWAGGTEKESSQGHYFRIQTDTFLFEYDNTQNNANHPHAVWRDFDGDFGQDLLRQHHEQSHHKK